MDKTPIDIELHDKQEKIDEISELTYSLNKNMEIFSNIFSDDDTVIYRLLENKNASIKCGIIFIDGMCNNEVINENLVKPIMNNSELVDQDRKSKIEFIMNRILIIGEIKKRMEIR